MSDAEPAATSSTRRSRNLGYRQGGLCPATAGAVLRQRDRHAGRKVRVALLRQGHRNLAFGTGLELADALAGNTELPRQRFHAHDLVAIVHAARQEDRALALA